MSSAQARWPYYVGAWSSGYATYLPRVTRLGQAVRMGSSAASMGRHRKSCTSLAASFMMPIQASRSACQSASYPEEKARDAWCELGRRACSDNPVVSIQPQAAREEIKRTPRVRKLIVDRLSRLLS
uniref:Uncharacterized protein n=1 Tax=Setaria viridis TaxID=4556 RepID=A0A4U6T1F2_SETVI|nr:hypothetical protein SEVIR_9G038600v2 [Setaria viridis]